LRYQAISSAGMGAEPLPAKRTLSRPSVRRTFLRTIPPRIGIFSRRSSFFGGIFLKTPSWNFSHSRGTEMKMVGRARRRSCRNVSVLSAK